jgi:hypothetical protein
MIFSCFYRLVVVQDLQLAKEVGFDERFNARPNVYLTQQLKGYGKNMGIITTWGKTWNMNRKFSMSAFKGK